MYNRVTVDPSLRINHKLLVEVMSLPITVKVTKFDEEEVEKFRKSMEDAYNTGQEVIPIVIDSYGGYVYSLLAMIDIIDQSPVPVATIGLGKMMSCGSVLLTCGAEGMRYATPSSTVMIHDVASGNQGKVEEIKASAAQTDKLNKTIFERMALNCGHDKNYFMDQLFKKHHAEWYLTAKEAKKQNVINIIGSPSFSVDIGTTIEFGV
jgi:ATP-dependent Clp endopeptidase proteolytic subunit ClpP